MESAMLRILSRFAESKEDLEKRALFMGSDNPVNQAIGQMFMQAPPPNLGTLAALMAQKVEKQLREDLERPSDQDEEAMDPLVSENKRLSRLIDNLRMKKQMIEQQKELASLQGEMAALQGMMPNPAAAAAAGGLPPEAGGVPPEVAAQGAMPPEGPPPAPGPGAPMPGQAPPSVPQAPPGEASGFGGTPGAGAAQ